MKKNQIILIIIGVLIFILIGLAFYFLYWQKLTKPEAVSDPCQDFPKIEGEITCQEAENAVLEKYPGDVKYIEKSNIPVQSGKPPETEMTQKDVWVIGILLRDRANLPSLEMSKEEQAAFSKQSSKIEVVVDRYEKNILFYTTDCTKCLE